MKNNNLYKLFLSCCLFFKKIIYFLPPKSFISIFHIKLALIRVYYTLYYFIYYFIQFILLLILQLIFIYNFGTYTSECEGSFLGNMIIINEKTDSVEIWLPQNSPNPNMNTSGPLFLPPIDSFNAVAEANSMFDRYLDTLSNPHSKKRVIECIVDCMPNIETSSVFNDPNHSYLVLEELYNLAYLNSVVRTELLHYITVYNLYVNFATDNLSSIQAAILVIEMPMDLYMEEYSKVRVYADSYLSYRYSSTY